jgi:hypothetical protein
MSIQMENRQQDKPMELCCWCDIPLAGVSHYKELVCIRCYQLLINAGLKDEEIFKDINKDTDTDY